MSYLPLVAFFLCVAYMIWRGFSDKRRFLREREARRERAKVTTAGSLSSESPREKTA